MLPLPLGSWSIRSFPHTTNGHGLVIVVRSSGCALEIGENRWHLLHFWANSIQSAFIVASSSLVLGSWMLGTIPHCDSRICSRGSPSLCTVPQNEVHTLGAVLSSPSCIAYHRKACSGLLSVSRFELLSFLEATHYSLNMWLWGPSMKVPEPAPLLLAVTLCWAPARTLLTLHWSVQHPLLRLA